MQPVSKEPASVSDKENGTLVSVVSVPYHERKKGFASCQSQHK